MSLHAPSKWGICVRHNMLGNAQSVFHIIHKVATQRWHYSILPRVLTCTECVMRYTVVFRKITKYFTFISLPSSCCKFIISGCMYIRCLRRSAPVGKESSLSNTALHDITCTYKLPNNLPARFLSTWLFVGKFFLQVSLQIFRSSMWNTISNITAIMARIWLKSLKKKWYNSFSYPHATLFEDALLHNTRPQVMPWAF